MNQNRVVAGSAARLYFYAYDATTKLPYTTLLYSATFSTKNSQQRIAGTWDVGNSLGTLSAGTEGDSVIAGAFIKHTKADGFGNLYSIDVSATYVTNAAGIDAIRLELVTAGVIIVPVVHPITVGESVGAPTINVGKWLGAACATPSVSGVPEVDITHINGSVASGSGTPDVNVVSISSGVDLTASMKSSINIEVLDVLATDVFAELGSVPAASSSLKDKIAFLFMLARNKITQTSTTQLLKADDGSTTVGTATVSDDGTTFTKGEMS